MSVQEIIAEMRSKSDPEAVKGMARFGISTKDTLGLSIPTLRTMAKRVGKDHKVAQALWDSGIHEARILAAFVDEPSKVSEAQMERWVKGFDSWDVCDQCCSGLFDKTDFAYGKALEWSTRDEEFVKRAGFVLMAALAVHDKKAPDSVFRRFFERIEKESTDQRNFVKKAVNWALRQIGKRNIILNGEAVKVARTISSLDSASAKWLASDAIRELTSKQVQNRLRRSS